MTHRYSYIAGPLCGRKSKTIKDYQSQTYLKPLISILGLFASKTQPNCGEDGSHFLGG